VAGARESVAISKVDGRDGAIRSPQAEELRFQGFRVSRFQSLAGSRSNLET
jgi:hypothetical protein